MKRCNYTWEEWDEEKKKTIEKQCSEVISEGSEKYCMFHDSSKKKNFELFEQRMKGKLAKGDYNFRSHYFPKEWSFRGERFGEDTEFTEAKFQGNVTFRNCVFQGAAHFDRASFQGEANFSAANFQEDGIFLLAEFWKDSYFSEAKFQHVTFTNAVFQGDTTFFEYDL